MPYFTKIQSPATKFLSSDFSLSSFSLTYSSTMSESSESSTGGLISTIEVSPSSTSSEPLNQSVPASLFLYHLCGIFFGELVLFHRQAFKRVRCQTSYKSSEYNPLKYSLLDMHQHLRYIGSLLIFIITGVIIPILLYKINNYLSIFILM